MPKIKLSSEPIIFLGMATLKNGLSVIYQLNYDHFANLNNFDPNNKTSTYGCSNSEPSSEEQQTQKDTADWSKICQLVYTITALFAFFLISISDKYGRKKVLLLCLIGQFIFYLLHLLQFYFEWSIYFVQIFATVINGLTGGTYILLSICFAALADDFKNDDGRRGIRISIGELCIGLGASIVAFLNGLLLRYVSDDLRLSLSFITLLQFLAVIYCLLVFDDSNQILSENHQNFSQSSNQNQLNLTQSFIKKYKYSFTTYTRHRPKKGTLVLWLLVLTYVFNASRDLGQSTILTFYERGSPFCWTKDRVSFVASIQEGVFVVGILLGMILTKIEWIDRYYIIMTGILVNVLSSVLFTFSSEVRPSPNNNYNNLNEKFLLSAIICPILLAPAITPLLRSEWVKFGRPDEHAAIYGLPAIFSTLSIGCFSFIYQSIYAKRLGEVFYLSIGLDLISLGCFLVAHIIMERLGSLREGLLEELEPGKSDCDHDRSGE